MKNTIKTSLIALLLGVVPAINAPAQTTAFTYQGRLESGGAPANGIYDLRFTIYDSAGAGGVLAGPVTNSAVGVTNGLFTTLVDLGNVFTGASNWLEIAVSTNGANAFSTLAPRQQLTPTPYASYAANAGLAASVPAGSITSGMLAPGAVYQLSVPGGGSSNAVQVAGNGLVGIGTNSPQAGVQISSAGPAYLAPGATPKVLSQLVNGQGGYTNLASADALFVSDGVAYVGSYQNSALNLIDVSNPSNPVLLSQLVDASVQPGSAYTNLSYPFGIFVTNHIAYVPAFSANAVNLIDVSNPRSPQLLSVMRQGDGQFDHLTGPVAVKVVGTRAYIVSILDSAINVVDVSNPRKPVKLAVITNGVAGITNMLNPRGLAVAGNTLYVTSQGSQTLSIIDISNLASPHIIAQITNNPAGGPSHFQYPWDVVVRGNLAYVACGGWFSPGGLSIFDVSNPANPVLLSEIYDGYGPFKHIGGGFSIALQGNNLFLACERDNSAEMLDISDPRNPGLIADIVDPSKYPGSPYANLSGVQNVFIEGGVGYVVAANSSSFTALDFSARSGLAVDHWVGIGTTTPRSALEVAGAVTADGSVVVDGNNANSGGLAPGLVFGSSGTEGIASRRTPGGNQYGLDFYTQGSSRMSIANNGSVGIGTANPAAWLEVESGDDPQNTFLDGTSGIGTWLTLGNQAGGTYWHLISTATNNSEGTAKLLFSSGPSPDYSNEKVMILDSTGKVGIGTANPAASLQINGGVLARGGPPGPYGANNNGYAFSGNGGDDDSGMFSSGNGEIAFYNNANEVMCLTNGLVGLGTTTPAYLLDVNGSVNARGTVYANGVALTSDRNAKENFTAVNPEAVLAKVASLPITEWNYKSDDAELKHIGPMAQDFHAAFGLNGSDDKHISMIDEGGVALAAIQGLNQKVETENTELKAQVVNLHSKVADLQLQLESLQKAVARLAGKSAGGLALNTQPQETK